MSESADTELADPGYYEMHPPPRTRAPTGPAQMARAMLLAYVYPRAASETGRPLVYFAHSKLDYGSPRAIGALIAIATARPGAAVLDPSRIDDRVFGKLVALLGSIDRLYAFTVALADEVIALEHEGHVGRGVYRELEEAAHLGKPRHVLRDGVLLPVVDLEIIDPADLRVRFGRVIT